MKGKLVEWNDAQGYGFIRPINGGADVFVQIRSFPFYQRRPKKNDVVAFCPGTAEDGRRMAKSAQLAGIFASAGAIQLLFFTLITVAFGVAVARSLLELNLTTVILGFYALLCPITFAAYLWDKQKAISNGYRIPEKVLHLLEFLGGWPAAIVAQRSFRHKIRKVSYQAVFIGIVLLHLAFWSRSLWLPTLVSHAP